LFEMAFYAPRATTNHFLILVEHFINATNINSGVQSMLFLRHEKDVDDRDEPGHDGEGTTPPPRKLAHPSRASSTALSEMRDQPAILPRNAI
jgi:hypothetical protein